MRKAFFGLALLIAVTTIVLAVAIRRELKWQARYYLTSRPAAESRGLGLPPCPGCNLVVVSLDTLRADALDWSNSGITPNLARIAKRSIRFTRAYANAFYTTPSHMSFFTSLYPNRHRVTGSDVHITGFERTDATTPALDPKFKTLTEVLRQAGYATHWFGPLSLKHLDLELGFGRGFEKKSPTLFARPSRFRERDRFNDQAYHKELQSAKRPFFHFLHSYVTHLPYFIPRVDGPLKNLFSQKRLKRAYFSRDVGLLVPPAQDADRFDVFLHSLGQFQLRIMEGARQKLDPRQMSEQEKWVRWAYDLSVRALDSQMGKLWDQLSTLDRTLVVILSDHGEELFEHGRGSHSTFYEHTVHIPLLIRHPDVRQGQVYNGLVSLVDLVPTLLSTLELAPLEQAQGRDLNQGPNSPIFGFALGSSYVFDGEWKLIRNAKGEDELYNVRIDREEKNNLISWWWPTVQRNRARLIESRQRWELEQKL